MHLKNRLCSVLNQALHRPGEIGKQGLSDLGLQRDLSGKGTIIGIIRSRQECQGQSWGPPHLVGMFQKPSLRNLLDYC